VWETQDQQEAIEGIKQGLADFEVGRFRTLEGVIAEKRAKHGL
jgi:predicted transcriptional regulator